MNNKFSEKFTYFLNSKKHVLVVSFTGLAKKTDTECFEKCLEEVLASSAKNIIINLAGVKDLSSDVFNAFSNMQLKIREKDKQIYVCAVSTPLRLALLERGIIRSTEIFSNLIEALQKIISAEAK